MSSLRDRNDDILRRARAGDDVPVRVLVQTRPGLVRGDTGAGRRRRVLDAVARAVWGRAADAARERLRSYRARWGRPGTTCWFLVDHASPRVPAAADGGVPDEGIPILWYLWNGDELVPLNQQPPRPCLQKLQQDYPFGMREKKRTPRQQQHGAATWQEEEEENAAATAEQTPHLFLAVITQRLRRLQALRPDELAWLAENPQREHRLWGALTTVQLRWYRACSRGFWSSSAAAAASGRGGGVVMQEEVVVSGGGQGRGGEAVGVGGPCVAAGRPPMGWLRAPPPGRSRESPVRASGTGYRDALDDRPDQKASRAETWGARVEPPPGFHTQMETRVSCEETMRMDDQVRLARERKLGFLLRSLLRGEGRQGCLPCI